MPSDPTPSFTHTSTLRRRARALVGLLAGALLIAACSSGTPEPTATPVPAPVEPTVTATTEATPESVLGPLQPTAIPMATAAPAVADAMQSPVAAPTANAQAALTGTLKPVGAVTDTQQGIAGGVATAGTFEENNALCEQFIGEAVPAAVLPYLRCGTFTVPEEHAKPDGRQVKLPVVVIKSASDKPAPDPVLVLQGGPGGSGVRDYFNKILREGFRPGEDRDVILVDQRGSFLTEPALICTEYRELYVKQIQTAALGNEAAKERQSANEVCKQRLEASGINLAAYNSIENAADIAALPRKLGYTDYNIYGISYGSLLAQHILALYPQGVRSLILDGVMPRAGNYTLTRNGNFEQTLKQVLAACAADALCAKDYPNAEQRLTKLVNELNASPAAMEISSDSFTQTEKISAPLTGLQLMSTIYYMLLDSQAIGRVPRLVDMVEKGDLSYLSRLRNQYELKPLRDTTLGLFNSILCSEEANYTPEDVAAADAVTQPEFNVFRTATEIAELCKMWNVPALPADAQTAVQSDIPVLVLNGQFDPATPAGNSKQATSGFANLTEATFPGEGHGQFPDNKCTGSLVSNFLNAPTTKLDIQCAKALPPLEFSTAGTQLVDFTDVSAGLGGVRPAGWIQIGDGGFVDDVSTAALLYNVSTTPNLNDIQRGIEQGNLKRTQTISASSGLSWTLFSGTSNAGGPELTDWAIGKNGAYVIQLITANPAQRDQLYKDVFLPALDKFIAIKTPAQVIVLNAPQPGAELSSPAHMSGVTAKTPLENYLTYRVLNGEGLIISEGPINVKGALGSPGVFAASLPFTVTQREAGRIDVVDVDAATGKPLATTSVTVTLMPTNLEGQRPIITITLTSPQPNAVITSPAKVNGSITLAPFENNLIYRVFDGAGNAMGDGPITTEGELGQPAVFDAMIIFTATQSGPGRVLIEDANEAGGPPFATAAVDVRLSAPIVAATGAVVTPTATAMVSVTAPITPTSAVVLTEAITATSAVTTATAMTPTAALSVDNVSLDPGGVARSVRAELIPAVPYDPNTPPGGNGVPAHVRLVFDRDKLDSYFAPRERQLLILPVEAYRALYSGSGDQLQRLDAQIATIKDLLAKRPVTVTGEIPVLPAIGAAQVLHSNVDYVDFAGGSCVRFITAYRQDASPITDADTFYTCQGLSDDGKYYVSFTQPLSSTALPASAQRVTRAALAKLQANYDGYIADVVAALNALPDRSFRPDLARLDEMLRTLAIKQ